MWEWWKNLLKRFTYSEEEFEKPVKQIKRKQASIHTKVTYQYPEKTPFRFPVIPDDYGEQERVLTVTKRPSRVRNDVLHDDITPIRRPENKKPFVPSDVPSPIYGYRNRRKKVEEVPAYMRRDENRSLTREETHNGTIEQHEQDRQLMRQENLNLPIRHEAKDMAVTNEFTKEQMIEERDAEQDRLNYEKSAGHIVSLQENVNNEKMASRSERYASQKVQQEPRNRNKKEGDQLKQESRCRAREERRELRSSRANRHKRQTQVPPYNVMMTQQDKFLQSLKKEQEKTEEKRSVSSGDQAIPYHLLNDPVPHSHEDQIWLQEQQKLLEETLKHFNVRAKVVHVTQGPTVTRFEVQPELGVKVSKVRNLSDDIKLNMAAKDIRIEAPIPGKNTIGIEVPNLKSQMVGLQEIFETDAFKQSKSPLTIGLGLSVEGLPVVSDIAKMPHGLIAGATGSGKSVCINAILLSILYKASYKDVKLLLIDPKMVELAPYNGLPHLVSPVITDVKAATSALKWAVEEMEGRYEKFVQESVRDIGRYNDKIKEQQREDEKMPYIVIVIDELADLMMASPQDVEDAICRIAQKARACGIHLLLATQRPSVDVITGLIKANVPTRIAFSVSSQVDSRTIIDMNGAERLLGKGDMLFIENGANKSIRIQGAFVSDEEIERVTNYVRQIAPPQYLFEQEQLIQMEMNDDEDELLDEAIEFVVRQNQASTSLLQRHFRIGYNRAARLMDALEARGIISGQNGSKPRDVLLSKAQIEEMLSPHTKA